MNQAQSHVRVGVGVIITKDKKVLLGKRKNAHGEGDWSFAGGHLELGESIEDCAVREALEETGLHIENIQRSTYTNDVFTKEHKHYITLFVTCTAEGEPRLLEPDKCEGWQWFDWNELPSNLFLPVQHLKESGFTL